MNDQGVYGFGQLATILRARYCEPKIESVTKTDGLTFRVREILEGVFKGRTFLEKKISRNGAADRAGDTTPTKPGAEAARAAAGTNEHASQMPATAMEV
jgi:hypothetical protein